MTSAQINRKGLHRLCVRLLMVSAIGLLLTANHDVKAEYGDIVLNNYSDDTGIRPVIFPHWFHRIRYACKACHSDLGIKFKAGATDINMLKIINGEQCGACHNGQTAWATENCDLCHSAKPGTPTKAHKSTKELLMSPLDK